MLEWNWSEAVDVL
jgi:hypothetical protein